MSAPMVMGWWGMRSVSTNDHALSMLPACASSPALLSLSHSEQALPPPIALSVPRDHLSRGQGSSQCSLPLSGRCHHRLLGPAPLGLTHPGCMTPNTDLSAVSPVPEQPLYRLPSPAASPTPPAACAQQNSASSYPVPSPALPGFPTGS